MRTRESLPFGFSGCPITGKRADERGFIDTGKTIRVGAKREPLIISWAGAHILGRHIGMLERQEANDIREENINLKHQIRDLELELESADAALDGTDALVKHGMRVAKVAGRKPKRRPSDPVEE